MPEIRVTAERTDSPFQFKEIHSLVDASGIEALQFVAVILDGISEMTKIPKDEMLHFLDTIWSVMDSDCIETVDMSKAVSFLEKFGGESE